MHYPSDLQAPFYQAHIRIINNSLLRYGYASLLSEDKDPIEQIWSAPYALVSHGTQQDPVFNFANQQALQRFAMSFKDFIQLPSRYSAEPVERHERQRLLDEVNEKGYIADYQGIRISSTGERFFIHKAIVWNLYTDDNRYYGQAAMFDKWSLL